MKISVIVPIYNAEKFIVRCIESIIEQTYMNWELILVDDGSSDDSYNIAKNYAQKNNQIIALHQQNSGAGAARNLGISYATGEYIVFVDSDDYIECDYLDMLINHNEDIVFINVNRRNEQGIIVAKEKMSSYNRLNRDDILRGQMTGKILWGGVRKAVKNELINKYNIRYSHLKVGEEAIYSFLILYYASSIGFINKEVYNYEVHSGSLSQSLNEDPWGEVARQLKQKVIEMGCYDKYAETINTFLYTACIVSITKLANKYKYWEYVQKSRYRIRIMNKDIDSKHNLDWKNMNEKAKICLIFIEMKMLWPIYLVCKIR